MRSLRECVALTGVLSYSSRSSSTTAFATPAHAYHSTTAQYSNDTALEWAADLGCAQRHLWCDSVGYIGSVCDQLHALQMIALLREPPHTIQHLINLQQQHHTHTHTTNSSMVSVSPTTAPRVHQPVATVLCYGLADRLVLLDSLAAECEVFECVILIL